MQNAIDLEIEERAEHDRPRFCVIAPRHTRLFDTQYHRSLRYLARLFLRVGLFKFKNSDLKKTSVNMIIRQLSRQ